MVSPTNIYLGQYLDLDFRKTVQNELVLFHVIVILYSWTPSTFRHVRSTTPHVQVPNKGWCVVPPRRDGTS